MTREEAKKILKRIANTSNDITHPVMLNTEIEAIKMAIEALEEQKTSQLITNGIGVRYCSNCRRIDNKYSVYER